MELGPEYKAEQIKKDIQTLTEETTRLEQRLASLKDKKAKVSALACALADVALGWQLQQELDKSEQNRAKRQKYADAVDKLWG